MIPVPRCILPLLFLSAPLWGRAQLLGQAELDTIKEYHSLESALREPDKVYRLQLTKRKYKEVPPEIRHATAEYRDLMDPLPAFLSGVCELGSAHVVLARDLYNAYLKWAAQSGEPPLSQKGLANRLQDHGLRPTRGLRGGRAWRGLRLRATAALQAAPAAVEPTEIRVEEGEVTP